MKIRITNAAFVDANAAMKPLVGGDSLGVFSKVRLDSTGHAVSLTGSNGDMQLEWRIKEDAIEAAEPGVKVEIQKDIVMFEAKSELSQAKVVGPSVKDAERMSWIFNPRLLLDALGAIDEDEFELGYGWGGAAGPVLITCSVPWLAVLMPLRVK